MAEIDVETHRAGFQKLDASLNSAASVSAVLHRACSPVAPHLLAPARAIGAIVAADVRAPRCAPGCDIALIDGRALASSDIIGAAPMSPAFVTDEPPRVQVGDTLPPGCDCVLDEALVVSDRGMFEIHAAAAPGDGVRHAGGDLKAGETILPAGARVSPLAVMALEAAGVSEIAVRRPRIRVVAWRQGGTASLIAALAREDGAETELVIVQGGASDQTDALSGGAWDAAFMIGGTGTGADDHSIETLKGCGEVVAHGLALDPGRTGGAGIIGGKAVLCIPGRFESALSVYLALARPLLAHLSMSAELACAPPAPLARKIASTVGVAQLALLQAQEGRWAPLCVGDASLSQLLRADAYTIIPEGSEGFGEGALVRPLRLPGRSSRT